MINPIKNPNGEQHHTEIPATEEDMATGLILGTARALRFHGLKIVNTKENDR